MIPYPFLKQKKKFSKTVAWENRELFPKETETTQEKRWKSRATVPSAADVLWRHLIFDAQFKTSTSFYCRPRHAARAFCRITHIEKNKIKSLLMLTKTMEHGTSRTNHSVRRLRNLFQYLFISIFIYFQIYIFFNFKCYFVFILIYFIALH